MTVCCNLLHVLGRLVALEPAQADLLTRILVGRTIEVAALAKAAEHGGAEAGKGA